MVYEVDKSEAAEMRHIISILIENESGALSRVAGLFSARAYNIESLTVAPTDDPSLSRMTLVTTGSDEIVEQVCKQLNKLIDVVKVSRLDPDNIVTREMTLVKVHAEDAKARSDVVNYVDIFRARVVDVSSMTVMVEITGDSSKINAFLDLMKPFGVKEVARTGVTALSRGVKSLKVE